jgi:predicted transcriptional regulator
MPRTQSPDPRITFRLPEPLIRKLDRIAKANERTMSAELRHIIRKLPDRNERGA